MNANNFNYVGDKNYCINNSSYSYGSLWYYSIVKHLTNKRRPIKYAEGTASVDFFNDLESPDIDRRRVGSHYGIGCLQRGFMRRFDNDPDNTSHDNTRNYDSLYDYDDYEEDF